MISVILHYNTLLPSDNKEFFEKPIKKKKKKRERKAMAVKVCFCESILKLFHFFPFKRIKIN